MQCLSVWHRISCLQQMQLTCNTHGHPNVCCCQGRCIIDAVTNVQNWTMPLAVLQYLWNVTQAMFATAVVSIAACVQKLIDQRNAKALSMYIAILIAL